MVPVAANSSVTANNQSGGEEEFATAEKYLNRGNRGAGQDNREAAAWLWKAVGKGNLAATMTLSDLYLRGDGVPKSCDQARLLLDVAARKGKASAGERLRNLQAFGCQ
jgi:TPR repeat protein